MTCVWFGLMTADSLVPTDMILDVVSFLGLRRTEYCSRRAPETGHHMLCVVGRHADAVEQRLRHFAQRYPGHEEY